MIGAHAIKKQRSKKEHLAARRLFRKKTDISLSLNSEKKSSGVLTFLHVGVIFTAIGALLLLVSNYIPNSTSLDDLNSIGLVCLVIGLALLVLNIFIFFIYFLYQRARREVEASPAAVATEEEEEEEDEVVKFDTEDPNLETILNLEQIADEVDCQNSKKL